VAGGVMGQSSIMNQASAGGNGLKGHHGGAGTSEDKNGSAQLRGGVTQTTIGQGHSQNMS
jgi:hypothetical protein